MSDEQQHERTEPLAAHATSAASSLRAPCGETIASDAVSLMTADTETALRDPSPDAIEGAPEQATPRKPGAPIGNTNAQRGPRRGLRSQSLPADAGHIENESRALRAEIEAELRQAHGGTIPLYFAALVQSCIRHEQLCQLAYKRLRQLPANAATKEHAELWAVIGRETDARDRCLRSMELSKLADDSDPWRTLYKPLAASPSEPATETASESAPSAVAPPEAAT